MLLTTGTAYASKHSDTNNTGSSGSSSGSPPSPPPPALLNNCPNGQQPDSNGNCQPSNPPPPTTCPQGQSMQNGQCVSDNIESCTIGTVDTTLGQSCLTCPDGFTTVVNMSDCPVTSLGGSSNGGGSSGGSSGHSGSGHSKSTADNTLPVSKNVTSFVLDCLQNRTRGAFNVTVSNASSIVDNCFISYKHPTTNNKHHILSILSHPQPLLLGGQIITPPSHTKPVLTHKPITHKPVSIKPTTTIKHTQAYLYGLRDGTLDRQDHANVVANESWSTLANDACNQGRTNPIATPIDFGHCIQGYNDAIKRISK